MITGGQGVPVAANDISCIPRHRSGLVFIGSVGASSQWIPPLHFKESLLQFCRSANPHLDILQLQECRGRSTLVGGNILTPKEDMYPIVLHISSCQSRVVPWQGYNRSEHLGAGVEARWDELTPCVLAATRAAVSVVPRSGRAALWPPDVMQWPRLPKESSGVRQLNCNYYRLSAGFTQRVAF